jgi:peptidoglycan/xylan/chitin deacetylase (PgdA/CDA1 family)
MAGEGLIRFGAHTRNHPILSRLDAQHLEEEIIGSREDIRSRLQEPVDDFAFPSGRREDIGEAALAIVRREFRTAATTVCRLNAPGQDLHLLCRVGIGSDLLLPRFKSLASGLYSLGK